MRRFSEIEHPLKRDGTSQDDRFLAALDPTAVKVDERTDEDILAFAFRYASQVSYYDDQLQLDDWTAFFQRSIPVQIALISKFPHSQIGTEFNNLLEKVRTITGFAGLFPLVDYIFDQANQVRKWQGSLRADYTGLAGKINNIITNDLSPTLRNLLGISNALLGRGYQPAPKIEPFRAVNQETRIWRLNPTDFSFISPTILDLKGSDDLKIETIKAQLGNLFQVFLRAFERISGEAGEAFTRSLAGKDDHEPHLGLFYAFLRLYQESSVDLLNQLTQKHLDFFYRRTLRIKERPIVPDKAHLYFEIPPEQSDQLVASGTAFTAGQDNNGAETIFTSDNELIVTAARIESLRTVFVDRALDADENECYPDEAPPATCKIKGIYKADVANSPDGVGEASFEDPDKANWPTLGSASSKLVSGTDATGNDFVQPHPFADLGLILAAPELLLQEGQRCIQIDLTLNKDLMEFNSSDDGTGSIKGLNSAFTISLSGESGWVEVSPVPAPCDISSLNFPEEEGNPAVFCTQAISESGTKPQLTFRISLDPTVEAITFPDPEALGMDFQTPYPLVKIELNQTTVDPAFPLCCLLEGLEVCDACITTYACGIRNLVLHNDIGPLDPNQPFQPFGFQAKDGNSFYIGSREIFCKNWKEVKINYTWDVHPSEMANIYSTYPTGMMPSQDDFSLITSILQDKEWTSWGIAEETGEHVPLFNSPVDDGESLICNKCDHPEIDNYNFLDRDHFPQLSRPEPADILTPVDVFSKLDSQKGFIRFDLASVDGNAFYIDQYQQALMAQFDSNTMQFANDMVPRNPYVPTVKDLSVDYCAKATINGIDLIHLHPFGQQVLVDDNSPGPFTPVSFFPEIPDDGNLYLGLSNVRPGGILSLLFQMAESTADAFLPMATVKWYYLKNDDFNQELRADIEVLSDETNGLINSGIVQLAIPADINDGNNLFPADFYWIRAAVERRPGAVAETFSVHSNAVRVTFQPGAENDLTRLNRPLPAKTIGQSVQGLPGLAGFEQPYESFGGRPPETSNNYYTRTSELLRHKGRGITIFDYERIVLEVFPEIFKAKCISHTLGRNVGMDSKDLELSPGFVTLAVIPALNSNLSVSNILEPRVPAATLKKIRDYLQQIISPFICLRVLNPDYERISVEAEVKFIKGKSPNFYEDELEKDLTQFLSPWAFGIGLEEKLVFGGIVYKSTLINFIEKRDYVDYIRTFSMRKDNNEPENEIIASKARAILVSGKHKITAFTEICCSDGADAIPADNRNAIGFVTLDVENGFEIL